MAPVRKTVASAAVAAALVAAVSSCRTDPIDLADNGGRPTTATATPSASPATATPAGPAPATPTAPTTTAAAATPTASAPATSTAPAGPIPAPATTQAQVPAPVPPPTTTRPATTPPSPSPRPVPAPSTAPAPAPAAGTRQDEVVRLTNVERQAAGCGPLAVDASLSAAAQAHSADMAANNYFSHSGLDGTSAGDRARAAGFPSTYVGENIAAGSATPAATIQMWMGSSGHRANILNCAYTHIGVGYAEGGSYRYYWTQVFGTR
ncbi:CAP domain-containing protein [Parafrankia sp. EUN1f]|uniref:CAP domain-containing protein n=1 Tax=Parafrankia sp. EUN1f TaxID=102897 RepID=UPI0001C439DF|nr:CAP domain-containing protein [Parafrankia sp. EUN1f]EFC85448.1 SCP-like extracellular [Parafrankia sp. EUN1f]